MRNIAISRAVVAVFAAGLSLAALTPEAAAQAAGPYNYHALTPCRVVDTRWQPSDPRLTHPANGAPKLVGQATRTFVVQSICNVPTTAVAVSVNITAVGPNGPGFLTLFPTGITRPDKFSNINFVKGEPALGNGGIVPLGTYSATAPYALSVYSRIAGPGAGETGGLMDMVLDVTGYFE